jgi:small subunit ribosomal protein S13
MEKPTQEKQASQPKQENKPEFKAILRVADKEVKGEVTTGHAIAKASGSSFMFANAILKVLKLDSEKKIGYSTNADLDKIEDVMKHPSKYGIPSWLFNRRKDIDTGEDMHVVSSDLELAKKFDIRRLRRIKCYIGTRHSRKDKGLKVKARGQRTRTTGRKKKKSVGVIKKNR